MSWLQGGPFLEVSFLMVLEADRQTFVDNFFDKLKTFTPAVEFATPENDLQEKLLEFNVGYPDDETDPNSKFYHQTQIPVYVDIDGKRKSVLSLRQISQKLVAIDFWFFGEESDASEWNQKGITENQIPLFTDMLHRLFDTFHFLIATVGYENSVTDLFVTNETWPHEEYSRDNINTSLVQVNDYFTAIIADKNFVALKGIKDIKVVGDKMVF
jgi:hypothetical protein